MHTLRQISLIENYFQRLCCFLINYITMLHEIMSGNSQQNVLKISAKTFIHEKIFKFSILPLLSCEYCIDLYTKSSLLVFSRMHAWITHKARTQRELSFSMSVIDTFFLYTIKITTIIFNFRDDNFYYWRELRWSSAFFLLIHTIIIIAWCRAVSAPK